MLVTVSNHPRWVISQLPSNQRFNNPAAPQLGILNPTNSSLAFPHPPTAMYKLRDDLRKVNWGGRREGRNLRLARFTNVG
jgi:hypothetical protein